MSVIQISSTIQKIGVIPSTGVLDPPNREHVFFSSIKSLTPKDIKTSRSKPFKNWKPTNATIIHSVD
jgi:hypothetical protein